MEFSTAIQKAFDLALPPQERVWRLAALAKSLEDVSGDIVECGSYRGGTAIALAATCPTRLVFAFDTFSGMPDVTEHDQHVPGDFGVTLQEVRDSVAPFPNIILFPGDIRAMVPAFNTPEIALLFIDCDLYEPHRVILQHLLPKMAKGGVIVFDDYTSTHCLGAKKAVDEFFQPEQVTKKFGFWTVTR